MSVPWSVAVSKLSCVNCCFKVKSAECTGSEAVQTEQAFASQLHLWDPPSTGPPITSLIVGAIAAIIRGKIQARLVDAVVA